MSIGNKSAFAQSGVWDANRCEVNPSAFYFDASGMTYRQWLIGQIAAGFAANPEAWSITNKDMAENAIKQADAIIRKIDEEKQ
jgi:hypothetical protein